MSGGFAKGHRLDSRQRESTFNQLLLSETEILRCPQVGQNPRTRALFSSFLQRTRKQRTPWRREGDLNPRDPLKLMGGNLAGVWPTIQPDSKPSVLKKNISTKNLNLLRISPVSLATRNGRKFSEHEHHTNAAS